MAALFLDTLPHTEEGAKLILTEEQERLCRVVYRLDKDGGASFAGLWNSKNEYTSEYIIAPIRSVFLGSRQDINRGTNFANILMSSKDPRPKEFDKVQINSWLDILRYVGCNVDECCATNEIYDCETNEIIESIVAYQNDRSGEPILDIFKCNNNYMDGGHVLINAKFPEEVLEDTTVYLLPICHPHNTTFRSILDPRWGADYYMKLKQNTTAAMLFAYLKSSLLKA